MKQFNKYNTEGFTERELEILNEEWEQLAEDKGLEEGTEKYELEIKRFADKVAGR